MKKIKILNLPDNGLKIPKVGRIVKGTQNHLEFPKIKTISEIIEEKKLTSIKNLETIEHNKEWLDKLSKITLEEVQKSSDDPVYQNQFNCAIEVLKNMVSFFPEDGENEHTSRNRHGLIMSEPQVGKTGLGAAIFNIMKIVGLWDYWSLEEVWLITGMDDCSLRDQSGKRVKSQYIGATDETVDFCENGQFDKTKPYKVFKRIDLKRAVQKNGYECKNALILIDECHYANGKTTILSKFLEKNGINWKNSENLREKKIFILSISATNYSELFSDLAGSKRQSVLKRGNGYYGIPEFLNNGQIYDASDKDFKYDEDLNDYPINYILKNEYKRITECKNHNGKGTIFVRANGNKDNIINNDSFLKENFNIQPLDAKNGYIDYEKMEAFVESMMFVPGKKPLIFIIRGGFRAGLTILESIKDTVTLIYDNSQNTSTTVQGLMGRLCGYRKNLDLAGFTKIYVNKYQAVEYAEHVENNYSRITIPGKSKWKDNSELTPEDLVKISDPSKFNKETLTKQGSKFIEVVNFPLSYNQTLELYDIHGSFEFGGKKKNDTVTKGAKNRIKIQEFLEKYNVNKLVTWDFIGEPYIVPGGINGIKVDGSNSNFMYSPETMKKFIDNDKPGGLRTEGHSHFSYIFGGKYEPEKHQGKRAIHVILDDRNKENPFLKLVVNELTTRYLLSDVNGHYKDHQDTNL